MTCISNALNNKNKVYINALQWRQVYYGNTDHNYKDIFKYSFPSLFLPLFFLFFSESTSRSCC